jgi:hypothetical protein
MEFESSPEGVPKPETSEDPKILSMKSTQSDSITLNREGLKKIFIRMLPRKSSKSKVDSKEDGLTSEDFKTLVT